ncbi:DL-glycerol-3-phosphatase 1 [Coniochaeta ligniaria NRRL 30616]|uniref:DL-glycerol-3-phosphatase 1 n=1 Tax=Coniochaeta ligniaria NRRL 30616 TaxID=1408157 RepID=A0A1J7J5V5_9PEZI|nr:DL-glycerol-3-phosphatase 1 [Coniochaeta ligniaria NRRL 30616]
MGSVDNAGGYSAPPVQVTFDGLLFDMDGTIIDSTEAVEKHWHTIGDEIGADPKVILQTSHGRRTIDMLKILAPEKATWEYVQYMESLLPLNHGHEANEILGARSLISSLVSAAFSSWAIVTSGTLPLVTGWFKVLSLPYPPSEDLVITAESVENGKPAPDGYLLARRRLGLEAEGKKVLVLEDSPAGIRAGKAAGCLVLGLVTSHSLEQVRAAEPDWVVRDLGGVRLVKADGKGVTLEIRDAWVGETE